MPFRNVALAAMEIATLHRMFPSRSIIGLGHGVQDWMAQSGVRAESPLTLLREYITALRSLLAGTEVTVDGRYVHLDRVRLAWPPDTAPGILVGAEGPKTKQLAADIGDGIILVGGTTAADLAALPTACAGSSSSFRPPSAPTGRSASRRPGYRHGESGLTGSPDEVAEGAHALVRAGATTVVLQPLESELDPVEFVRIAGASVQPLLRA